MLKLLGKKDVDMLNGPIVKGLLTIALPIMIMNVIQSMFNIIDMTILRNFGDAGSVGSVGVCSYLTSLVTGLLVGCSAGSNVVVSRFIGRRDKEGANKTVGTALLFAFLGGVVIALIGIFGARLFLTWMNCADELIDNAVLYFRLYFAGVPILMVYNFCAAILRSTGDSRRPMIFLTTGGILKVIFNFIFVAGFGMSVEGVAFATIISWSTACVLGLRAIFTNHNEMIKITPRDIRIHKDVLLDVLHLGIPAGLQQALYSIANVVISSAVNTFGADATTGISIANTFDGILYQIATAPALAVMPYVSQNLGAGNLKRAKQAMVRGMMIAAVMAGSIGALSAIFSGPLSSIMAENSAQIAYSQQKMMIISSTYFICGINNILSETMRGFRRPLIPTVATLIYMCLFRFAWVWWIFPHVPNLTFLYLVWPIGWILSIITVVAFLIPTMKNYNWKKRFIN